MDAQKREDLLWCGLTLALAILVRGFMLGLLPPLSMGDMGRDLYASWMVLEGKVPCRDFWWMYGPLMPIYYAFWFALGGVHLISFQIGLDMLYVAMAFIAFWALRLFVPPPAAFLTALAYLGFDYVWTFNHIGAIPLLLLGILSLWKFFLTSRIRWCYLGTLAFVGVALVKISVGPPFFLAFFLSLLFYHLLSSWKKDKGLSPLPGKHFLLLPLLFGLLVGGAYLFMYWGLSFDQIDLCMTLILTDRLPDSIWTNIKHVIMLFLFWQPKRMIWTLGYLILALLALRSFKKQKLSASHEQRNLLAMGSLVLFFLASLADYLILGFNARMRITMWSHPVLILLMGLLGGWALSLFRQPQRVLVYLLVFLWVMGVPLGVVGKPYFLTVSDVFAGRTPDFYLDLPQGRAFLGGRAFLVGSPPQAQAKIVQTLREVTQYIRQNTHPDEKILAVPYDILFCFLAGRRQAGWQMYFEEHHGRPVPESYDDEVIHALERERVRYIILSNSSVFASSVFQKLSHYIFENYEEVKRFETGDVGPLPALEVKILKKKAKVTLFS